VEVLAKVLGVIEGDDHDDGFFWMKMVMKEMVKMKLVRMMGKRMMEVVVYVVGAVEGRGGNWSWFFWVL